MAIFIVTPSLGFILTVLLLYPVPLIASPITSCPGYAATNVVQSGSKMTADLKLAGTACNTYGSDIVDLKLEVTYETDNRIHVKIADAANNVYQVPSGVLPRPSANLSVVPSDANIAFSYVAKPFSFAITRSDTHEALFNTTGFPFVFQSQYLLLSTSLPSNPNLYGLGEHTDTFRLPTTSYTRTLWSRDSGGVPPGSNLYGNHPVYYDHRLGKGTHAVFLLNSNGMDIKIGKGSNGGQTLSYNTIGGIFDFYFMAGPSPIEAVQQYSEVVGKSAMMPYWGLGFHQCSYNYPDIYYIAEVIANYSTANIPMQTMWTDIDYMDHRKVFTSDPVDYPTHKMQEVVTYLHNHGQNYILMVDPAVAYQNYGPFNRGETDGVFMKTSSGSIYKAVVWPGVTAYPDWFHPNITMYWNNEFATFFDPVNGVNIDGLWIDMNEPSNFCGYPCTNPEAEAKAQTLPPAPFASRVPPRPIPGFPSDFQPPKSRRQTGGGNAMGLSGRNLNEPQYKINNYNGDLSQSTMDTSLIHANGLAEYDTHNMYGTMMSAASRAAMLNRRPKSRPLIITRSTFAGAGAHVGHWLGDNDSDWLHYREVIGGILNFAALFQLPMVGADTCGFSGTKDATLESLCARWAMLGAFSPFFRNHNAGGVWAPQEFYHWPNTVAVAARKAIAARYKLLDYFYTALYEQSTAGTPALNPLWFIYPEDSNTLAIQQQYFFGPSVLVSPVTEQNSNSVQIYLPNDMFYDLWTYTPVRGQGQSVTLSNLAITDIPVHIRGGVVIPMRISGAMTTPALRKIQFDIVVAPGLDGTASGQLYLDDGDSIVQAATSNIDFLYQNSTLTMSGTFGYQDGVNIGQITFLGLKQTPKTVLVNGASVGQGKFQYNATASWMKVQVSVPLTGNATVSYA